MSKLVHLDPLSAWNYLREHGGLELEGRDEVLAQRIHQRLNPAAPSFDDALVGATMEAFARAFFEAIHPFVAMFRDILDFFEHADATKGQEQWTLRVDDFDLDLKHFRQWLLAWTEVGNIKMEVPAVDWQGVWRLWEVLRTHQPIRAQVDQAFGKSTLDLPTDVQAWVASYNRGEYLPLPDSLMPPHCPKELRPSASIAQMALLRLVELDLTREKLMELYRRPHGEMDRSDALDFWSIAQNETDYWLLTFVVSLSAAATHLNPSELRALGLDLNAVTNEFPLRALEASISIADLESVLSLPIWKKRYELYSVWIATEIVRALDGHEVELHHDNGRIAFAFRETLVATIHSSPGPFTLVTERRSPLENPRGEGRTGGVQPDHALWTVEGGEQICRIAVEVKHYKRSAKRKFVDIFEDYARAFPEGDIYLVNHGPTGNAVYEVSRAVRERCHAIQHLTPSGMEGRRELAKAVRECVGEPLVTWTGPSGSVDGDTVLVLDVSASMQLYRRTPAMDAFIRRILAVARPGELVAIDCVMVGSWPVTQAGLGELLQADGSSTALAGPVRTLLERAESVVIITDRDGLSTLEGLDVAIHRAEAFAPEGILVRVCSRMPGGLRVRPQSTE